MDICDNDEFITKIQNLPDYADRNKKVNAWQYLMINM